MLLNLVKISNLCLLLLLLTIQYLYLFKHDTDKALGLIRTCWIKRWANKAIHVLYFIVHRRRSVLGRFWIKMWNKRRWCDPVSLCTLFIIKLQLQPWFKFYSPLFMLAGDMFWPDPSTVLTIHWRWHHGGCNLLSIIITASCYPCDHVTGDQWPVQHLLFWPRTQEQADDILETDDICWNLQYIYNSSSWAETGPDEKHF